MRRSSLLLALMALFFGSGFGQSIVRGPYLQLQTTDGIIIRWRTDVVTDSRVDYGTDPNNLLASVYDSTATTEHSVKLSGLPADSKFFYAVGTGQSNVLVGGDNDHFFHTAPVPGTVLPIRAWVIGDFGKANQRQIDVREQYIDMVNAGQGADLWLWLGDNAYNDGTDAQYQSKVFAAPYGYQDIFRNTVFWPTPGNHDYNSVNRLDPPVQHTGPYFDIVDVPTNAEAGGTATGFELFYSFDYGNVHFLSLNSELQSWTTNPSSPLINWIRNDLQNNDKPWVVAYWHQPPYSKGSHDSDDFWELLMEAMRANVLPVLEDEGVDLVLCGHSHVYERSYLLNGHYGNSGDYNPALHLVQGGSGDFSQGEAYIKYLSGPLANKGTVYANVGNSGSYTATPQLNYPAMYAGYGCDTCVGSFILEVDSLRMDGIFYGADGQIKDQFTILKVEPTAVPEGPEGLVDWTVFPNPSSGNFQLQIELDRKMPMSARLYDSQGRVVWKSPRSEVEPGTWRQEIKTRRELPAGSYFLDIDLDGRRLNRRLVVQ